MKRCPRCRETKPLAEFHRDTRAADGLQHRCKPCAAELALAYRETRRETIRAQQRDYCRANRARRRDSELRHRYGISLAEFEYLLELQGGLCAVCRRSCPTGRQLAVDHNHETGQVRGLLCRDCNTAAGFMEHRPERLAALADYLLALAVTIPSALADTRPPLATDKGAKP